MIIATAGHVDHGKTTLVKALTGIETDRLAEERRRGLTIEPGFAHWHTPTGQRVSFIDVPGHERFIRNMLAGLSAVDFALLVIAADDGVMQQTREHLDVLDLLGISRGVIAITKADRATSRRIEAVAAEAAALVEPTALAGCPVVAVSAQLNRGLETLIQLIETAPTAMPAAQETGLFRMPIDRDFSIKGIGRVVTGTSLTGTVRQGDTLKIAPDGPVVRVRGLHVDGAPAEDAGPRRRVALQIAGSAGPARGQWLTVPQNDQPVTNADIRFRLLAGETRPLAHMASVHVHHGASHVTARVALLGSRRIRAGEAGMVQLVLDRPLHAKHGDAVILRDATARRTIGGGRIVDPFAPVKGRSSDRRLRALDLMRLPDHAAALKALLHHASAGLDALGFARARNLPAATIETLLIDAQALRFGNASDLAAISHDRWRALLDSILAHVAAAHDREPARRGLAEAELWRLLRPRPLRPIWLAALDRLVRDEKLRQDGAILRLPSHRPRMAAGDAKLWDALENLLSSAGHQPPALKDAAHALEVPPDALRRVFKQAVELGRVHQIGRNRYVLRETLARMAELAEACAAQSPHGEFTTREFARYAGIGRNLAVEVLEFLDREGTTMRSGTSSRKLATFEEVAQA